VATAPFAWYHQLGPTEITLPKAAFVGAVIGALAAAFVDRTRRERSIEALRSNPAVWLLALFALLSALSVFWAGSQSDAARDALKWVWYAGVFALAAAMRASTNDASKIALATVVTATVVGLYGIWQNATLPPAAFVAGNGSVVGRIAATLEGPNQFVAYLETAIPVLLALLLFVRVRWLTLLAGSLALGLLVSDLLLTYSRGALWSCAAALIFIVGVYLWKRRGRAGYLEMARPAAAVAAAVVAVAVGAGIAHASITSLGWQHELWAPGLRDTTESAEERRRLWTCAATLFERHPILGVGAGNFADAKQECGAALAVPEHSNANQWYLETGADLGAVGLLLLAGFLITMLGAIRSSMWSEPFAIGAYAVLLAFVLHGFVDDVMTYPKAALTFFVLLGLIARWTRQGASAVQA
jgi:O-antigen ligase